MNWITKLQAWLNGHPKTKAAVTAFEGAAGGVLSSYAVGIINGNGSFTGTSLKRTIVMASSTGLIAVYNMFKTVPQGK